MSRSSVEITDQEKLAFLSFARKHGIILEGDPGVANGALVRHNFVSKAVGGAGTWDEDITEASLEAHLEQLRPHLKFYDENEKAVIEGVEASTPAEKKVLDEFWAVDRQIETSTYNVAVLIKYLRGHNMPITHENLHFAVSKTHDLLTWRYQPTFKSKHEIVNDGKPTAFISGANKSPLDYRREMNEAAEKNNPTKPVSTSSVQAAAQAAAESLKGNTHSETEQLGRIFVTLPGTSEIDWIQTLASRQAFQRRLNNQQAVRRFIR